MNVDLNDSGQSAVASQTANDCTSFCSWPDADVSGLLAANSCMFHSRSLSTSAVRFSFCVLLPIVIAEDLVSLFYHKFLLVLSKYCD